MFATADIPADRIDRFLAVNLATPDPPLSRSRIKALILAGQLNEDGRTLNDPSASVKPGSHYVLTLPPPVDAVPKAENIALDILFEDKHLLVLNKPAGLVVHPAPGSLTGTLVNALIAHCGSSLTGIGGVTRPGIVHRLDKDTSGTMIVAKTEVAHLRLVEMFAAHDLDRRYQALVWGTSIEGGGIVDQPIGRASFDRKRQTVTSKGRNAITFWQILRQFPPFGSHIECRLETGRTHQIRVHLASPPAEGGLGTPILGDTLYGSESTAPRLCLHAEALAFWRPNTDEWLKFESPAPF